MSASPALPSLPSASLLQLIWLASPALPVGGFSYSEGLEAGVEYAGVATESVASNWLSDQLHLSLARGDLAVLAQAIPAWRARDLARVLRLNDWVLQTCATMTAATPAWSLRVRSSRPPTRWRLHWPPAG